MWSKRGDVLSSLPHWNSASASQKSEKHEVLARLYARAVEDVPH